MAQEYAILANSAYKPADDDRHEAHGYVLDPELSNRNRKLFYHPETGKAVMSFRGTNPKNIKDLTTDAMIALGMSHWTDRFRNARKATQAAVAKYGKENVVVTGHSLGGSQALYVNAKERVEAHAFNPGVSPLEKSPFKAAFGFVMSKLFKSRQTKPNATIYTTGTDPISAAAPYVHEGSRIRRVKATHANTHSIKNFL